MMTNLLMLRKWTLVILLFLISIPLLAEWPNDISQNLKINDIEDEQILPMVASTPDGGCYVSWFDRNTGSYRLILQKLDNKGNLLWGNEGLIISDQKQDTWLTGYDMIADKEGNVIVTFADIRNNDIQNVFAYKISPLKEFLWGYEGVRISESDLFEHSPRVVETTDGCFMFVWEVINDSESSGVIVQKLNSNGDKVFQNGNQVISSNMPKHCYSRIVASDNGSAIICFMGYDSDTLVKEDDMVLTVQKINAWGHVMFPSGNSIKLGIELQNCGGIVYFIRPVMISDGNNGAYLSWYDDRDKDNVYTTYIQHIDSQGDLSFTDNGIPAITLQGNEMLAPKIAVNPITNEPLLFWKNKDKTTPIEGGSIKFQRFNLIGKPVYGNSGKTLYSMPNETEAPEFSIAGADNGVYVLFLADDSGGNQCPPQVTLKCMFINFNGENPWNKIVNLSSGSPKYDIQATASNNGICKIAWCDQRNDAGGIYSQNINPDGTPGYKPLDIEDDGTNLLSLKNNPNPFSYSTKINYFLPKSGMVSIRLYDAVGNELKTLVNDFNEAGNHNYIFENNGLTSGVYFCRMETDDKFDSIIMVIME
ncbi:MAG: T9SS type A sorting domain-containing protein [Ignavibacteriae bacterium]|nr:T9SS type A sorting domain-containing protein [Ignavibacteriota bacterium]